MKLLDTGAAAAATNMEADAQLLKGLAENPTPILHFYEWEKPSATYGYFSHPEAYLQSRIPVDLARRPTGGGIIFHLTDLAFSVLIPASHPGFSLNTMENYRYINKKVSASLNLFDPSLPLYLLEEEPASTEAACCGFCMAKPTQYDVMAKGKKAAGGAQRRTRHGYLHQGSICLALPERTAIEPLFKDGLAVWDSMQAISYPLIDNANALHEAKEYLRSCLTKTFLA